MRSRKLLSALLAGGLALTPVTAACGGDDEDEGIVGEEEGIIGEGEGEEEGGLLEEDD